MYMFVSFTFNLLCSQAKRTLLMRHEAEIKSNAYWLGLLAHLQATSVPRKVIQEKFLLSASRLGIFRGNKYTSYHRVVRLKFLKFACCMFFNL